MIDMQKILSSKFWGQKPEKQVPAPRLRGSMAGIHAHLHQTLSSPTTPFKEF
jgi:hypothetical protein